MTNEQKQAAAQALHGFRLPRYHEIPNVGLYLEQTTKYIASYLDVLHHDSITASMISNYVKKGLITNPVRKLYDRDQIAYLIFIAIAKTVLSLEDIQLLIQMQKKVYPERVAYEYFCQEFENILAFIFGLKDSLDEVGVDSSDEKTMLRNTIITVAHKVYLDKYFAAFCGRT